MIGCPKSSLPTIEGKGNFDKIKETYDFGEVVTIICNEKYEIKGESQSTCNKKTSTFSPNTIVCQEIQGKNLIAFYTHLNSIK